MKLNKIKPDLNWIANKRIGGDEWITYTKSFRTSSDTVSAVVRFECDCTCAVYINGTFVACVAHSLIVFQSVGYERHEAVVAGCDDKCGRS